MISKEKIESIVSDYIKETSLFLVEIKISATNVIEVVVDDANGVDINRCIEISRHIESFFDREIEDFELTVASAGIGDAFKTIEQYHKHDGKEVEVKLTNGLKQKGIMSNIDNSGFTLTFEVKELVEGKKRKQLVSKEVRYSFEEIKAVFLVINF